MSQTITLELPTSLASTAQAIAMQTKRSVEEVLVDWLNHVATEVPLNSLSNQHILALTRMDMEPEQQTRLSDLLARNRENQLTDGEIAQLDSFMQKYRQGLKQKAEALKIAVERGLIPPLG